MKLTRLTTTHEEFLSWLRLSYPGHVLREYTDACGSAVEVIEPQLGADWVVDVVAVPASVYHDQSKDEILFIPNISERNFPEGVLVG